MPRDMRKDAMIGEIIGGRSLEETVADVEHFGLLFTKDLLRRRVLWRAGIRRDRERAENVVFLGCSPPFTMTPELCSSLRLLTELGIPYTYLDKEYCCGLPLIETARGEEQARATRAFVDFMARNLARAKELGAKNAAYYCIWCAYLGKKLFPQDEVAPKYFHDILLDSLHHRQLRVRPQTIGYYAGCHSRNRRFAPGVELDWKAYRRALDRIEGLRVIDLKKTVCCVDYPDKITQQAEGLGVDSIVCSCNACHIRLSFVASRKVAVKYYTDLLLEALQAAPTK